MGGISRSAGDAWPTLTQLVHLVYASLAVPQFNEHEIPALLEQSRKANAGRELTGLLLYIEGSFFQVLEGNPDAIDAVYGRIARDPRHTRVTSIIREPIAQRSFSEWTMGFSAVDTVEAGQLVGENDFFKSASCVTRLDGGRAKKLLSAFRAGRWRMERTGAHPAMVRR
jgi:hypothetical protein